MHRKVFYYVHIVLLCIRNTDFVCTFFGYTHKTILFC